MSLRKEPVTFLLSLAVLGLLLWSRMDGGARTPLARQPEPPERPEHAPPDVDRALPAPRSVPIDGARELFSPPSDTRPLPPLDLVVPPLEPLPMLRPPPVPGPAERHFGRFLRIAPGVVEAPDLFAEEDEAPPEEASAAADVRPMNELSPEERRDRIAGYKQLYDWYRVGEIKFGYIRNPDRYTISRRPNEPLLFVEVDPRTGAPRLPGQPPAQIPRANLTELGFADTVQNRLELQRIQFGDPLPASEYDLALSFAESCLEARLETPRALEIAAERFQRAAAALREDPAPRLGLARVHEAAFEFEKAFALYDGMLAERWAGHPLVLARLAELEARFRLYDRAERHLREAERLGRTTWQVQEALGRYLLARGRGEEAIEPLRLAHQYEPTGPESKRARARLRNHLADAYFAAGRAAEAAETYEKALQADAEDPRAQAGLVALAYATSGAHGSLAHAAQVGGETSFELLAATGLAALPGAGPGDPAKAASYLAFAAEADPLRAWVAWRALSYLAERTAHPEDALRFVELALENAPHDAWSHYQRGRLLAQAGDLERAAEALEAALATELDFPDALALLGEIAFRAGRHEHAERYLERAVALDPALLPARALRGINQLELGDLRSAEATFEGVLAQQGDHPTARLGLAWCAYRKGGAENATEALTRYRELDDARRALPEDEENRVYARAQIERITDHLEKVAWTDRFERAALINNWDVDERHGPVVTIHDGLVTIGGAFKSSGRARLWRLRNAGAFVAFEAELTVRSPTSARVGLFLARETVRAGQANVEAEATISRHHDATRNTLQTRVMKRGEEELAYTDVPGFSWPLDQPVRVRIERTGTSSDTRVRLVFDGVPVLVDAPMPALGRTNADLYIGVFAEGQPGRAVQVDVDDVEVVYREQR